jgi:hypothetical protein
MTKERAKELLPIIKAFSEGEIIQYERDGVWEDCFYQADICFDHVSTNFRIKLEHHKGCLLCGNPDTNDNRYCGSCLKIITIEKNKWVTEEPPPHKDDF